MKNLWRGIAIIVGICLGVVLGVTICLGVGMGVAIVFIYLPPGIALGALSLFILGLCIWAALNDE